MGQCEGGGHQPHQPGGHAEKRLLKILPQDPSVDFRERGRETSIGCLLYEPDIVQVSVCPWLSLI